MLLMMMLLLMMLLLMMMMMMMMMMFSVTTIINKTCFGMTVEKNFVAVNLVFSWLLLRIVFREGRVSYD